MEKLYSSKICLSMAVGGMQFDPRTPSPWVRHCFLPYAGCYQKIELKKPQMLLDSYICQFHAKKKKNKQNTIEK